MTGFTSGDIVGGYRIERLLGCGGMAEVYRARIPGRPAVALKLVTARFLGDELLTRFAREVGHAALLDHAGCLRVVDHGRSPLGPFLVSELLVGPTLRDRLGCERFTVRHALRVADELLAALEHAHARGVIHRDLKPENVMYRRRAIDRDVVLIDFGLARLLGDAALTHEGTCLGSPSYLAPERILGHPGDGRADLYAVGTILFELLTGRTPFRGDSSLATARLQVEAPVPDLAAQRPDLSPQLCAVVRCALAKDPAARFVRAATMRAALEDAARATWELAAIELDPSELVLLEPPRRPPPLAPRFGPRSSPPDPPALPRRTVPLGTVDVEILVAR